MQKTYCLYYLLPYLYIYLIIIDFRQLKNDPAPKGEPLGSSGIKPMTSPSGPLSSSPSPVLLGQFAAPSSNPANHSEMSSLSGGLPSSSLEMLLLERAKLLQQQNPMVKALADLQGNS